MAVPEWYKTDPAQIIGHAERLRGVADDVREALSAVEGVSVPGDTYGESGGLFAKMLDGSTDEGCHTLIAAVVVLEGVAKGLKDSATEYQNLEDAARRGVNKAGDRQ